MNYVMNFWIKHSILALVLIVVAFFLLRNYEFIFQYLDFDSSPSATANDADKIAEEDIAKAKPATLSKQKKNKAAEGLSKFYASLNPGMDRKGPVIRNNVVYLQAPQGNINHILEDRLQLVKSISANWQGSVKTRRFIKGETIYQKLMEYVSESGMELIWWLDKDFIVKSSFRVDKSVIQTAYSVGKSIAGHYPEGVDVYFCNRHRAIVLISSPTNYVIENCRQIRSTTSEYEY